VIHCLHCLAIALLPFQMVLLHMLVGFHSLLWNVGLCSLPQRLLTGFSLNHPFRAAILSHQYCPFSSHQYPI
jgi:hypothetical protein